MEEVTLYDAELDGIPLEVEFLDDTFEKAIAVHEIPGRDGALLEDMGQKAHRCNLRCHFWDSDSHRTFADYQQLVNHLAAAGSSELIHPFHGPLQGRVERVSAQHDDRIMYAQVDISFIEELRGEIDELQYQDVAAACEESYLAGEAEQMDALSAGMRESLGVEAQGILERTLAAGQTILEQVGTLSAQARSYVLEVDHFVAGLEAELSAIAQPANSLISTIDYGLTLPGRVIGAVSRTVERYVALYDSALSAPARFLDNMEGALNHLAVVLGLEDTKKSSAAPTLYHALQAGLARRAALELAGIYKKDEQARRAGKQAESAPAFDRSGRFRPSYVPDVPSVLTVDALESTLYTARRLLAPEGRSSLDSAKALALQLLQHVNQVKLEREKLVPLQLDNPLPLHLVCLKAGLPYGAAPRILAVNRIPKPCYVSGEVVVYVR